MKKAVHYIAVVVAMLLYMAPIPSESQSREHIERAETCEYIFKLHVLSKRGCNDLIDKSQKGETINYSTDASVKKCCNSLAYRKHKRGGKADPNKKNDCVCYFRELGRYNRGPKRLSAYHKFMKGNTEFNKVCKLGPENLDCSTEARQVALGIRDGGFYDARSDCRYRANSIVSVCKSTMADVKAGNALSERRLDHEGCCKELADAHAAGCLCKILNSEERAKLNNPTKEHTELNNLLPSDLKRDLTISPDATITDEEADLIKSVTHNATIINFCENLKKNYNLVGQAKPFLEPVEAAFTCGS